MTLEEAIKHCEQKACSDSDCSKEHKQLAEWLKELTILRGKFLRNGMKKIPLKFTIGGQEVEIRNVERCDNNAVGECHLLEGYIEIADTFNKDQKQSDSSKVNTFYHELTHCILQTMNEGDLNLNERFVSCFASFLTEAMCSSKFEDKQGGKFYEENLQVAQEEAKMS